MRELIVFGFVTFALFLGVCASFLPVRMHSVAGHFIGLAQTVALCAIALAILAILAR
jgi:branched-subunit amino acid permease